MAVLLAFTLTSPIVEAKKLGGSKSFGKSHKTAPAQPKKADATNQPQQKNQSSSKKGLMGGLLGGLLAGGLIAAMMGGAFEGFQMMDFLMIALLAFIAFKIFKAMSRAKAGAMKQQPAYAGNNQQRTAEPQWGQQSGGQTGGNSDVPFNLPQGFNLDAFLTGSKNHYNALQQAWNVNNFDKIQEYVTPELYNNLREERAALEGDQHTEVMHLNAELVRAEQDSKTAQLSVKFTGRYRDTKTGEEEDIQEVWHLERQLSQANAPWLIVGIQQ